MQKNYKESLELNYFIERLYSAVLEPNLIYSIIEEIKGAIGATFSSLNIKNVNEKMGDVGGSLEHTAKSKRVGCSRYGKFEMNDDIDRNHHVISCGFALKNNLKLEISFQRDRKCTPFESEVTDFLDRMHPHFEKYANLSPMFEDAKGHQLQWQQSLEHLGRPVWVINSNQRLLFSNQQAEHWNTNKGYFSVEDNYLMAKNFSDQKQLESSIGEIIHKSTNPIYGTKDRKRFLEKVTINSGDSKDRLWISPLEANGSHVLLITGRKLLPAIDILMARHRLTRRQAELCTMLSNGMTLHTIAIELNISINTARNTLSASFRVLQVKNQSELIRTLLGDVVTTD